MANAPYAIRKGFEYQDHFCCCQILDLLTTHALDTQFEIESDTVLHVDDCIIYDAPDSIIGIQVKFHVDQGHQESFDTLTARKTDRSKCLIEKIYAGWKALTAKGRAKVRVEFVSSNPAQPGRYNLGPVIDNDTHRFNDKFFSGRDYQSKVRDFKALLGVDDDELREFLGDVEWRLNNESLEDLRRRVSKLLNQLRLPFDEDAVSRCVEVVSSIATGKRGTLTLQDFVQELWTISRFRDACEQRFTSIDFGASQVRRANTYNVAVVALETLPAVAGSRFACTQEPVPFGAYHQGITATDKEGLFDQNRMSWEKEYLDWLQARVDVVLAAIEKREVDLIVFPRLTLPISVAANVAERSRAHKTNCVLGGHSLPPTERERDLYKTHLNTPLILQETDDTSDLVVDCLLRHDRAGRMSISRLEQPFHKTEGVLYIGDSLLLDGADGRINVLVVPSRSIAQQYAQRPPARPELIVVSGGIHADDVCEVLSGSQVLQGVPAVVVSSDTTEPPSSYVVTENTHSPRRRDSWEGVSFITLKYERTTKGWAGSIAQETSIPLVYRKTIEDFDKAAFETLRGESGSRGDAIDRIQQGVEEPFVICAGESPAEFFCRRAKEAEQAIRSGLTKASPGQIVTLATTLKAIDEQASLLRARALLPVEFAPPPQRLLPARVAQFLNRTSEKSEINRALAPSSGRTLLLLHGEAGIGKRELLGEVQRVHSGRDAWVRFRCVPNARLNETIAQLFVRLGSDRPVPDVVDSEAIGQLHEALREQGTPVLVLEDAHFLPFYEDHPDHVQFLSLLSAFASDMMSGIKVVLISERRGRLAFSGSHRMETIQVGGLDAEYIVELLQEHVAQTACKYQEPTLEELHSLAARLHGHPYLARLASVVLEDTPAAEVSERLYERIETREFIVGRLLRGMTLSERELQMLSFASLLRTPVSSEAFVSVGGPSAISLLDELARRFLMIENNGRYNLHPVLSDFYSSGIRDAGERKRLHGIAFDYYTRLKAWRSLSIEERTEYFYHGVSSEAKVDSADMRMFAGSIRTALDDAVRAREWSAVENAAQQLLSMWPTDVGGHIGMALALDATGRERDAHNYAQSLAQISQDTLWLGLEFVKLLIRRRDFDSADRNLAVIYQRFGDEARVKLAAAQLFQRKGETPQAVELCEEILTAETSREHDAFLAGLILRDSNRLDLLVRHMQAKYEATGFYHTGLLRVYSLASVLHNYDPEDGLHILSELWKDKPGDGDVVADYASALIAVGRTRDAEEVLKRGLTDISRSTFSYRAVLETYAQMFEKQERFIDAFKHYRDALGIAPNHLHIYRAFARCLIAAASSYRTAGDRAQEDSAVAEAEQILGKLLQLAPRDTWAADELHRVTQRAY